MIALATGAAVPADHNLRAAAIQLRVLPPLSLAGLHGHIAVVVDGDIASSPFEVVADHAFERDLIAAFRPHPEDVWRFASVTKQIVAVAVMQAVERGELTLDAPVARYAPALRITNADGITIRELLQHRSGLPNPEDGPKNADGVPLQYLRSSSAPAPGLSPICHGPAKGPPGGPRFEYNNCDYEVLGAVLESVTHQPLAKLLEARIFRPAGMTSTRLLQPGDDAGRPGFDAKGNADIRIDVGRFGAAAGLAGPPSDLARFDRALLDGRLLSSASLAEMWRGDPKLGFEALGQWSYTVTVPRCGEPKRVVERRGEVGDVEVRNLIFPDRGMAAVVFADRPIEFGEPWQGKGLTFNLIRAALCTA